MFCLMTGQASSQVSTLNTLKLKFAPDIILTCLVPECGVPSSSMAGVVASKVRRARVKSLIDKEDQIRKASIAIIPNPAQERYCQAQVQVRYQSLTWALH